jgi:hypothetical protein
MSLFNLLNKWYTLAKTLVSIATLLRKLYFIFNLYAIKCMLVRKLCLNRTRTGYIICKSLFLDSIWSRWIQSSILYTIYLTFIIIPAAHLRQDLLVGQCPIKFSNQKHASFLIYSIHLHSYSILTSDSLYLTQVKEDQIYMYVCIRVFVILHEMGGGFLIWERYLFR